LKKTVKLPKSPFIRAFQVSSEPPLTQNSKPYTQNFTLKALLSVKTNSKPQTPNPKLRMFVYFCAASNDQLSP
jgi:hypothetical protein